MIIQPCLTDFNGVNKIIETPVIVSQNNSCDVFQNYHTVESTPLYCKLFLHKRNMINFIARLLYKTA